MCPLTPGAVLALLAYGGTTIATIIMAVARYERWWMGLIVMGALVLFSVFESFCWMFGFSVGDIRKHIDGCRRYSNIEEKEEARKALKDALVDAITIPLCMGLIVAILGLVAIPIFVYEYISDLFAEIYDKWFKVKKIS